MILSSQKSHILTLDGLRGLAILLVFIAHTSYLPPQLFPVTTTLLALFAECGVNLFFCLSGFLITGILYDAKQDPHYFRNFYARRTLRIFPLYYLYLLLYYLFVIRLPVFHALLHLDAAKTAEAARDIHWAWFYATNLLIYLRGNFITASLNHFWTLAVEEHFYLLWPLLVFWLSRRRLLIMSAVVTVACLVLRIAMQSHGTSLIVIESFTPCRVDSFAIGGAVSLLLRHQRTSAIFARILPVATILTLAAALAIHLIYPGLQLTFALTLFSVAFSLLLGYATLHTRSPWMAPFRSAPMRFLGKYSYALYVFHFPIQVALARRLSVDSLVLRWHSYSLAILANMAVVGFLSLAVALPTWNLWEKPFLRLKRFFEPPQHRVTDIDNAAATSLTA